MGWITTKQIHRLLLRAQGIQMNTIKKEEKLQ